jgi:hypothetical protein
MLKATMFRESGGRTGLTSSAGAKGLFQFLPDTLARLGGNFKSIPSQAIAAARYLIRGLGGKGGFLGGGIEEAFATFFAGEGGGNRGSRTRSYVRDQSWVMRQLMGGRPVTAPFNPNPLTHPGAAGAGRLVSDIQAQTVNVQSAQTDVVSQAAQSVSEIPAVHRTGTSTPNDANPQMAALAVQKEVVSKLALMDSTLIAIRDRLTTLSTTIDRLEGVLASDLKIILADLKTIIGLLTQLTTVSKTSGTLSKIFDTSVSVVEGAAFGGYISGRGGPRDDLVPAWLSNGEYVIQAAAVKALGLDRLHQMNNAHKMLPKFGAGDIVSPAVIKHLPKWLGGTPAIKPTTGFWKGSVGSALSGGLISAAFSIGMALLGRLFAKKAPKTDPNRKKDPYGLNPETLTFYKKPIISGVRNYLASGGMVTSSRSMLNGFPSFADGGMMSMDSVDSILDSVKGAGENFNISQNINITTPDIHSFRNSRSQVERDIARFTQRGIKRKPPKY